MACMGSNYWSFCYSKRSKVHLRAMGSFNCRQHPCISAARWGCWFLEEALQAFLFGEPRPSHHSRPCFMCEIHPWVIYSSGKHISRYWLISVQLLDDQPLKYIKPIVQDLLADKDKNKQRGAAELLAAIVGGAFVFSFCFKADVDHLASFQALVDGLPERALGLDWTSYSQDLQGEYKDRYTVDLDVVLGGRLNIAT